jgi:hypothetical protein
LESLKVCGNFAVCPLFKKLNVQLGVLSIFLGQFFGSSKSKPVVHLYLRQASGDKIDEWTSLEPMSSSAKYNFNEGTLMVVQDVFNPISSLRVQVMDQKSKTWFSQHGKKDFVIKDLLGRPYTRHELIFDNQVTLDIILSLYHHT